MQLIWIKLTSSFGGFDSSTVRAVDHYPKGASSNPASVNIFHFTSAVSDYHEKFLFMYIFKDSSEIEMLIETLFGILSGLP